MCTIDLEYSQNVRKFRLVYGDAIKTLANHSKHDEPQNTAHNLLRHMTHIRHMSYFHILSISYITYTHIIISHNIRSHNFIWYICIICLYNIIYTVTIYCNCGAHFLEHTHCWCHRRFFSVPKLASNFRIWCSCSYAYAYVGWQMPRQAVQWQYQQYLCFFCWCTCSSIGTNHIHLYIDYSRC